MPQSVVLAVAPLGFPIRVHVPSAERVDVADLDAGRNVQQLVGEIASRLPGGNQDAPSRTSISVAAKSAG